MTDPDDIDMLAAEYVLGTLDHDERSRVAEQRNTNAELDAAIIAWEQRLGHLTSAPMRHGPALNYLTG